MATKTTLWSTLGCLAVAVVAGCSVAGESVPGASDFRPSPENPIGWRGDGSGKYPGATPPLHWNQSLKQLGDFRCAAAVPKDNGLKDAAPTTLGFFTEWLVAGPVPCADPLKAIKEELTPGEANLAAHDGDKLGDAVWKTAKVEDSFIDLFRALGPMTKEQAAYAQACLYVEKPAKIWFHFVHARGLALWLNGKAVYAQPDFPAGLAEMGPTLELSLQAGWNRFVFKLTPRVDERTDFPKTCYVRCRFWPAEGPRDYASRNISWISQMPGLSHAMPIVVGDYLFTTAQPYNLVCVDKKTGNILWIRSNSPYDAATADERKANPAVFLKLAPIVAKRDAYYAQFLAGQQPTESAVKDEADLETEMDKLMLEVDPEKYKRPDEQGEPDWWTIPTPASDGKGVFVFLTRGVSAAYELDGKCRWIRYERPLHQHHGYFGSPVIADKKFVILDGTVSALDLTDGTVKWTSALDKVKSWRLWFGSLTRCKVAGTEYVLCPGGNVLMRATDGHLFGGQGYGNFDSTPVFDDGASCSTESDYLMRFPLKAEGENLTVGPPQRIGAEGVGKNFLGLNFYQGQCLEASPLIHEGLIYAVSCNGVLMVYDIKTGGLVYRQVLPLDLLQGSQQGQYFGTGVTLAGQSIYLMGSSGVMIVIKPGRVYEELARNRIQYLARSGRTLGYYRYYGYNPKPCPEYQDNTMTSTPIFDGTRMYLRGEEDLYCVEETR